VDQESVVRALVKRLVEDQSFEGRDELLAQVPFVRVADGPLTFLALDVDRSAVPASLLVRGHVPGCAWVRDAYGEPLGTLAVWVDRGYLSALEYGWVTGEAPAELPGLDQIYYESV
jgi:hypothetical protein